MGSTWKTICKASLDIDELDIPFTNSFVKRICKGDKTLFWVDKWLNNSALAGRFNRLFKLESNPEALVMNKISKGGNISISWDWKRTPSGRTRSDLNSLNEMPNAFEFTEGVSDTWAWNLQPHGLFSWKVLDRMIDDKLLQDSISINETERLNLLPQKVGVFISRAKQRQIPVRVELDKRGVDLDSVRCPVCDNDIETVEHTLLHCSFAKDLWSRAFRWWNVRRSMYSSLDEMFKGSLNDSHNPQKSTLWQAIEWVCGYIIWRNRNNIIFHKSRGSGPMALNELQLKSFEWISRRSRKLTIVWSQWLLNPSTFDDHG
ncbi:uncharacterized protein [Rutidosis leptorrhynchoides]|uniref:uncharacterized protein n=1 Tax=Rutidosis leptorrhynchoides TaxID=125765 RepID=UPI003A9A3C4F